MGLKTNQVTPQVDGRCMKSQPDLSDHGLCWLTVVIKEIETRNARYNYPVSDAVPTQTHTNMLMVAF